MQLLNQRSLRRCERRELSERFPRSVVDVIVKVPYVAGAKDFLVSHKRKIPMFVACGTSDRELHEIVERRGMSPFLISVHGAPAIKEEIVSSLLEPHEFNPSRVVMVGDAMADSEGAEQAGVEFLRLIATPRNRFLATVRTISDLTLLNSALCS